MTGFIVLPQVETSNVRQVQSHVRYVEVSDTTGLRWQRIARAVRDHDEEKVRESKEDVDTLLVFVSSGCYSLRSTFD